MGALALYSIVIYCIIAGAMVVTVWELLCGETRNIWDIFLGDLDVLHRLGDDMWSATICSPGICF